MLMFWNEKLLLLAVPKTGSTALSQALRDRASGVILDPPELKHCPARRYLREIAPWVTRDGAYPHETVAVIREPVDWLGSWFRYRQRPQIKDTQNSTRGMDFDAFVTAWMSPDPPPCARIGSQSAFLCDPQGPCLVDHLFRYEEFDRLTGFLRDRLGDFPTPPAVNLSPRMGLALSEEVEERLRDVASRDFELWEAAAHSAKPA